MPKLRECQLRVGTSFDKIQAVAIILSVTNIFGAVSGDSVPSGHISAVLHGASVHEVLDATVRVFFACAVLHWLAVALACEILVTDWDTLLIEGYTF